MAGRRFQLDYLAGATVVDRFANWQLAIVHRMLQHFAAGVLGDFSRPGMRALLHRMQSQGDLAPAQFVDSCLDLIGPMEVEPEVRQNLVAHASEGGTLRWGTAQEASTSSARVGEMLQLIASIREFQYA